jgi:sugar phosphate isomerase/epimerase
VKRSLQFAGAIGARYAIIHPGFITPTTDLSKAIHRAIPILRELTIYAQHQHVQLLLENVYSSNPEASRSIGCDFWELDQLITGAQCGFCLDFPHAVCAAVTLQRETQPFIQELTTLQPAMFHLYDGWQGREYDQHLPLGQGNLDIPSFLRYITDQYVTLEVHPPTLTNFLTSYHYLQRLRSHTATPHQLADRARVIKDGVVKGPPTF